MKEKKLSEQLNEINEKFSISRQKLYEFSYSIHNFFDGNEPIGTDEKINKSWEFLNAIKKFQDEVEKEIRDLFLATPDEKLPEFIVHVKCFDEIYLLRELGYPRIRYTIPKLFQMLMDYNWPSARKASELLLEIGTPVLDYLDEVFNSNDTIWIYWVLLPKEDIILIKEKLINIIKRCQCVDEDYSNIAFLMLFENDLINEEEILLLIHEDNELNFILIFSLLQIKKEFIGKLVKIILKISKTKPENFTEFLKSIQINIKIEDKEKLLKLIENYA